MPFESLRRPAQTEKHSLPRTVISMMSRPNGMFGNLTNCFVGRCYIYVDVTSAFGFGAIRVCAGLRKDKSSTNLKVSFKVSLFNTLE
jgi:hypothetical protein